MPRLNCRIPEEVIKEYNLHQLATPDGWVYVKVTRAMYGLPQDFGIKYINKDDLDHLIRTLEKYYEVSVDLDGKEFVKIEHQVTVLVEKFPKKFESTIVRAWFCGFAPLV